MLKRLRHLPKFLNLLLVIVTLLAYIAPYLSPSSFWVVSFFGAGYSWLLVTHLFFILYWGVQKHWYIIFSLCCILLGWNAMTAFIGLHPFHNRASEQSFSVMSYNVNGFRMILSGSPKKQTLVKKEFHDFLSEIDILCAQETGWSKIITNDTIFPHHIRLQGTVLFSQYPFENSGKIDFDTPVNACVWADVVLPNNKTIRIYNVHFQSNAVSDDADRLREEGDLQEKETWEGIGNMIRKYKDAVIQRAKQAEKVATHIQTSPYPVIVGGDFNDTPQSYSYQCISNFLEDNFQKTAFGIGTTYAGSIPGLKIDYIFSDSELKILQHKILKQFHFSDHYPVKSIFAL